MWDITSRKETKRLQIGLRDDDSEQIYLARSPNGKVVFLTTNHTVEAWDISLEKRLWQINFGLQSHCWNLAISRDGARLAFATLKHEIMVLESGTGEMISAIMSPSPHSFVRSVRFSLDGASIIAAYSNSGVIVWDISTKEMTTIIPASDVDVRFAAPACNGQQLCLLVAEDRAANIWDLEKQTLADKLRGHKVTPSLAFFLDNSNLFTADTAGAVIHWDSAQKKLIRKYQCDKLEVIGLAISPDQKRLAAACENGNVVIFDLEKSKTETPPTAPRQGSNHERLP
jgi:WD40 repeat protein